MEEKLLFLEKTSDEINEKRDFLNFQAKEIDSIALRQNEDVILHRKFKKLTHVKEIIDALNISNDKLFNKDDTVISQINHIKNIIINSESVSINR